MNDPERFYDVFSILFEFMMFLLYCNKLVSPSRQARKCQAGEDEK